MKFPRPHSPHHLLTHALIISLLTIQLSSRLPAQQQSATQDNSDQTSQASEQSQASAPNNEQQRQLTPPPANDPWASSDPQHYTSLWEENPFSITPQAAAEPPPAAPVNPLEGIRLLGLVDTPDGPIALIEMKDGQEVHSLTYERGIPGYDLIDAYSGQNLEDSEIMLAGPQGEGYLRYDNSVLQLPSNQLSVENRQNSRQSRGDDRDDRDDRGRGRGRWSEEERQEALERVASEQQRIQRLIEQSQDPSEIQNLRERLERVNRFRERITD